MHTTFVATRVLAVILFGVVGTACGQAPPGDVPAALSPLVESAELPSLPLVTPAVEALATHPSLQAPALSLRNDFRKARVEQQHHHAMDETVRVIRALASDPKQDLAVKLTSRKHITGRILFADATSFRIRPRYSRQEFSVRYDEVSEWSVQPRITDQVLEHAAFAAIGILLFPFFLLAGLSGWDGC